MASGPLSVPLPDGLRKRLARHAKKNNLKLATAARALIQERLEELDQGTTHSDAVAWQLEEVWRTADRHDRQGFKPVSMEGVLGAVSAAMAKVRKRRGHR